MAMSTEEMEASRKKPRTDRETKLKLGTCQAHDCSKPATGICKYCSKHYCTYHLQPKITTSFSYIQSLEKEDYEKWKKYDEDWQQEGGHPCVSFTIAWNKEHENAMAVRYQQISQKGPSSRTRVSQNTRILYNEQTYKQSSTSVSRSSKGRASLKIIIGVIILLIIGLVIIYVNGYNHPSILPGNQTSSNPQPSTPSISSANLTINQKPMSVPLDNLIANSSSYLNKTVITQGFLMKTNTSEHIPSSYLLYDPRINRGIMVVFPSNITVNLGTNYTVTGIFQPYHVPPGYVNTNNWTVYYINATAITLSNSGSQINTTSAVPTSSGLQFCINRMVFRTSNSRGDNESQIQQLINYCEYYGYAPGVQNGTNWTLICQGVKECQSS